MKLSALLEKIEYTGQFADCDTDLVTDDSRKVREGCVFVCSKGATFDGHTFATKAVEIGAVLIVAEKDTGAENQVIVKNSRAAYALLCSALFGNPSEKMKMIAVTGTNGKTTSAFIIKDLLTQMGKKTGLMGTVQNMIGRQIIPAKFTTPQPYELHALLSQMYKSGCEYVVMEASSQALRQNRLYGIEFDAAVFTNLTRDHLDYHKTMDNYFAAKCILFENSKKAVVNIDDRWGKKLAEKLDKNSTLTFSDRDDGADYTAKNTVYSQDSVKFIMVGKNSINRVNFPMPGEYSVHNAMGAALAAVSLGFDIDRVCEALSKVSGVKGRCEVIVRQPFTVITDFAHTDDGLENILSSLRPFVKGKFFVLFGCAGERDATKRILMAKAVSKYADYVIMTSDNPRGENRQSIIDGVTGYFDESGTPYTTEANRRTAIKKALSMLSAGDTLILCGKGHEDYQALDGMSVYLDERVEVQKFMKSYCKE